MTGYLYDAGGTRVAKGTIQNMNSCDPAANGFLLATEHDYILGPGGEQMTEMYTPPNSTLTTAHANVWVGGILATYDLVNGGLHFALTDPLGTKRVQVSGTGVAELNCLSLPFGNSPGNPFATDCVPVGASTASDATEHHFTGKERDTESGNDYFGARYYGSSVGRFMSPDWSAIPAPIPYGNIGNPQSFNLYGYATNNPLRWRDKSGHVPCGGKANISIVVNGDTGKSTMSQSTDDCPNGSLDWFQEQALNRLNSRNHRPAGYDPWQGRTFAQQVFQGPGSGSFVGANKVVNYAAAGYAAAIGATIFAPALIDAALTSGADAYGTYMATKLGTGGAMVGAYYADSAFSYEAVAAEQGMNSFTMPAYNFWEGLGGYGQIANDAFTNGVINSGQTVWTSSTPWLTGGAGYLSESGLLSNAGVQTVPFFSTYFY